MDIVLQTKDCALAKDDAGNWIISSTVDGMYRQVTIEEDYAFDLLDTAENQEYWVDAYILSELQTAKKQKNGSYYEYPI